MVIAVFELMNGFATCWPGHAKEAEGLAFASLIERSFVREKFNQEIFVWQFL